MDQIVNGDTLLLHRIAVANRNAAVIFAVKIIGQAERRTDFILTAVTLSNRTGVEMCIRDRAGTE